MAAADVKVHLERVSEHRRLGEHAPAWTAATERLDDGLDRSSGAAVQRAAAAAALELGRFADAREHLARAAAAAPDDQWLAVGAAEAGYRADADGRTEALGDLREQHLRRVRTQVHEQAEPLRVPWLWLLARLLTGVHPDERPTWQDLDLADGCLATAAAIDSSTPALALERVRVARCRIAVGRRRGALIDAAGSLVAQCRRQLPAHAPSDPVTGLDEVCDALDYEQGRLLLYARQPEEAAQFLGQILAPRRRPGHQAARVWQITAERLSGAPRDALLARISMALPASLGGDEGSGDGGPTVVSPELVAHLLVERAILLGESGPAADLQAALADALAALERRPRMELAHRRVLRTLLAQHRPVDAQEAADTARRLFADDPPAQLLVEIGEVHRAVGERDAAVAAYDEALRQLPTCAAAYEAIMRLQRGEHRSADALETYSEAVAAGCDDVGGLRLEAAVTHLADDRPVPATALARPVLADPHAALRRRAQVVMASAALLDRRLEEACELAGADADDPDLVAVHIAAVAATGRSGLAANVATDALDRFGVGRDLRQETRFTGALARSYRALGRTTAAEQLCSEQLERIRRSGQAATLGDGSARLLDELGWIALDRADATTALPRFAEALRLDAGNPTALCGRLVALGRSGRPWESIAAWLRAALRRDAVRGRPGTRTLLRVHAGRVALERGLVAEAEELFANREADPMPLPLAAAQVSWLLACGWAELAADHVDGIVARDPDLADDHLVGLLRALAALTAHRHEEASAHLETVLGRFPTSEPALLASAVTDLAQGDTTSARTTLDAVVEASPHSVVGRGLRMQALVAAHAELAVPADRESSPLLADARAECRRVMELEPSAAAPFSVLGILATSAGRTAEAAGYLRQAVRLSGGSAATRADLAELQLRIGEPEEALDQLHSAPAPASSDGSSAAARSAARLLLLEGVARSAAGDVNLAVRRLRQAVAQDRTDPAPARALALALESRGDLDAAVDVCDAALRTVASRRSSRLLLTRARLQHARARQQVGRARARLLDAALADLDRAEATVSGHPVADARFLPDVWYQRAVLLLETHDRIGARRALAHCLAGDPEHGRALHAIRVLESSPAGSESDRHLRRWARVLGAGAATALAVVLVLLVVAVAGEPAQPASGVLLAAAAGSLGFVALAAALPRLAGSDGHGDVQLPLDDEPLLDPAGTPAADPADLEPVVLDGPPAVELPMGLPDVDQAPFLRATEPPGEGAARASDGPA